VGVAAVGLHHQALAAPQEVDLVALELDVHLGERDAVAISHLEEQLLEVRARARAPGRVLDKHARKHTGTKAPVARREPGAIEPKVLGLVDGTLEAAAREDVREIHERAAGSGDGDALVGRRLGRREHGTMDLDVRVLSPALTLDRDLDRTRPVGKDAPERGGTAMAQHGPLAAREHRGHPTSLAGEGGVADRVHAAVHSMQSFRPDSLLDRPPAEPERLELPAGDHPVLPHGELDERRFTGGFGSPCIHTVHRDPSPLVRPPLARRGPGAAAPRSDGSIESKAPCPTTTFWS
jgi:hypothetical protein